MVLLDHFANKSNTSLSLPLSHFLLGSPLPPIPDSGLMVPCWLNKPTYCIRDIVPNCIVLNTGFGIYIEDAVRGQRSWWPFDVDLHCLCGIFRTWHICSTLVMHTKTKDLRFKIIRNTKPERVIGRQRFPIRKEKERQKETKETKGAGLIPVCIGCLPVRRALLLGVHIGFT